MSDVFTTWAKNVADEREAVHNNDPSTRTLTANTHLSGLAGEFEFGKVSGLMPDTSRKPKGDKGIDFRVPLVFTVDVKTRKYRVGEIDLLVEQGKVAADIYVMAVLHDDGVTELIGWEWASVIQRCPTRDLGTGVINHWKPGRELRPMSQLTQRLIRF